MGTFILKRKLFGVNPGFFNLWKRGQQVAETSKALKNATEAQKTAKAALDTATSAGKTGQELTNLQNQFNTANKAMEEAQAARTAAGKRMRNSVIGTGVTAAAGYGVYDYTKNKYDTLTGEKFENKNFKNSDWGV